jgi:membrane-associated phospholipid phosphatase
MMDGIDLGCAFLRTPFLAETMEALGFFGRAGIACAVAVSLLGHGYFFDNPRSRKTAIALIVALIVSAVATELVRYAVQLPRPKQSDGYGFPSGHTSAAFSFAAVLGIAFPQAGPLFYLVAVLTGISRLYFRAHYVVDVLGGGAIGVLIGIPLAKRLIVPSRRMSVTFLGSLGWLTILLIGAGAGGFFYATERSIAAHKMASDDSVATPNAAMTIDFGSPQARPALGAGWSGDESWEDGRRTLVWATGFQSEMQLHLPAVQDYLFRVNLFPYAPGGLTCQRVAVEINANRVTELFLEKGWHWYEFEVPKNAIRSGLNRVEFFYAYAQPPVTRRGNADSRPLSAAFDRLDVVAGN